MFENSIGKRENNKFLKKQMLLNAAYKLFISKGSSETTISDITKSANVGKGTFYLYFKDKISIKEYLIIYKSSEIISYAYEKVNNKDYENREDKIIDFCDIIVDSLNEDKNLLKLIHKNLSLALYKKVMNETQEDSDNIIKKVSLEFQRDYGDKFEKDELPVILFIILEMVGSLIYNSIIDKEPIGIEELKPYLYKCIRKILR